METLTQMIQGHTNPTGLVWHLLMFAFVILGALGVLIAAAWESYAAPRRRGWERKRRRRESMRRVRNIDSWGF